MRLMTLEVLKQKKINRKAKRNQQSKRLEYLLLLELKKMLEEALSVNDKIMIEVPVKVLSEFQNILSDSLSTLYAYEQIDANKFVFYSTDLVL